MVLKNVVIKVNASNGQGESKYVTLLIGKSLISWN